MDASGIIKFLLKESTILPRLRSKEVTPLGQLLPSMTWNSKLEKAFCHF